MDYTIVDYLAMFFSNFVLVCLLGIQSKNVQNSRYFLAVTTSFGISIGQFIFTKYAAAGSYAAFFTCAIGACCGIATSIWLYDNVFNKRKYASGGVIPPGKPYLVGEQPGVCLLDERVGEAPVIVKIDGRSANLDAEVRSLIAREIQKHKRPGGLIQ